MKDEEASRFSRKPEKREAEPGARGVERKSCAGGWPCLEAEPESWLAGGGGYAMLVEKQIQ